MLEKVKDLLMKLGFLNEDEKISITNTIVIIFVSITAFKLLFCGMTINTKFFTWKIESLDISSSLPLLFGLLNYGHKRQEISKIINETT
jgi:hypothetical protein